MVDKDTVRAFPPPGRKDIAHRDWTEGSILKNVLLLSWPMAVTQTVMALGPTIDIIWVGRLGAAAVAGVGISGVAMQFMMSLMMGLFQGMRALIARAVGSKDMETAHLVAQQSIVISAMLAAAMAIIGHFFSEEILRLITPDPEIVRLGTAYLSIAFIGGATMVFRMMLDAIMQASGDPMNPMWIAIIYRLLHVILCPFLIFGWWIFPELGVRGAAYTGVIAQGLGVVLGLGVLLTARSRISLSFRGFRFDAGIIWRILRIGLPASVTGVQQSLNQFILQIFMALFGAAALAAHVITMRLEMFIFMPAMSFGMGAGVLVGQNLGARQPERAKRSAWIAAGFVEAFVIAVSLVIFIWIGPVVHLFSAEPAVDILARQFIYIAMLGWIVMGFLFVLMSGLQGAGDTLPPMVISITTTWLVTVPLAYFLSHHTSSGAVGVRWAITASVLIGAAIILIYFRTGKWKWRRV